MMRLLLRAIPILFLSLPAVAGPRVDLALVLAVDVSASINRDRYDLQREGFAAAFSNPAVIEALSSGETKAIVATLVEWSGPGNQKQMIGWTLIDSAESATAFGSAIGEVQRAFADFTSISGAIDFSAALLRSVPYEATRKVVDISGDGSNNSGRPVSDSRDAALAEGIIINGLAILASEPRLDVYYKENVIGGDGSFVVVAQDFAAFATAILNKLVREIASSPAPASRLSVAMMGP